MSAVDTTQVTISLLPTSLSLVHIPRSRLPQLTHPILKQILQPKPTFLNVTCNEIELSLFAGHTVLSEFEPIARADRQKHRLRTQSNSRRRRHTANDVDVVEVSYERWNVLQIDSHADSNDNSGARVRELSAPLAAAGISILYQSSYMSDFILVKAARLQEVMTLLGSAGFRLHFSDPDHLTSQMSPLLSAVSTDESSSLYDLTPEITFELGAVLTRTRSSTDASLPSFRSPVSADGEPSSNDSSPGTVVGATIVPMPPMPPLLRTKSHSPAAAVVDVLAPDLTCVGLSDDSVDLWSLKIIKLVSFPDLIPNSPFHSPAKPRKHPFSDFNYGSMDLRPDEVNLHQESTLIVADRDTPRISSPDFMDPSASSGEEDGYYSASPYNISTPSLISSSSRSMPDLDASLKAPKPPRRPSLTPLDTSLTIRPFRRPSPTTVPFFSFTRTAEGSSLTTDVALLAALFSPNERHMVICGNELDAMDTVRERLEAGCDPEEASSQMQGTLKCLQIDLQRFGLEKHGLVNRFSHVLDENGINHMYSSTFKSANLLVYKADVVRAQSLLRSC